MSPRPEDTVKNLEEIIEVINEIYAVNGLSNMLSMRAHFSGMGQMSSKWEQHVLLPPDADSDSSGWGWERTSLSNCLSRMSARVFGMVFTPEPCVSEDAKTWTEIAFQCQMIPKELDAVLVMPVYGDITKHRIDRLENLGVNVLYVEEVESGKTLRDISNASIIFEPKPKESVSGSDATYAISPIIPKQSVRVKEDIIPDDLKEKIRRARLLDISMAFGRRLSYSSLFPERKQDAGHIIRAGDGFRVSEPVAFDKYLKKISLGRRSLTDHLAKYNLVEADGDIPDDFSWEDKRDSTYLFDEVWEKTNLSREHEMFVRKFLKELYEDAKNFEKLWLQSVANYPITFISKGFFDCDEGKVVEVAKMFGTDDLIDAYIGGVPIDDLVYVEKEQ